jgi:type I restriction enzyme, S subunit
MKVPKGWRLRELGDVVRLSSGGTPSRQKPEYWGSEVPWFSGKDLKRLRLATSIERITEVGASNGTRTVPAGTVLVLVRGMTLMKDFPVGITTRTSAFNQDLKALTHDPKAIHGEFLAYALVNDKRRVMSYVNQAGHGTGRLGTDYLEAHPIKVPPLWEQRRIAEILGAWDEAIEKVQALIQAKQKLKRALMQVLLLGSRRFPQFKRESWVERRPVEFLRESRLPGSRSSASPKLSIKLYAKGVVPKDERFSGSERTIYYRRSAGQLVYSKLDFLNGAVGLVPPELDGYESTQDLPAFDFVGDVDPNFFSRYIGEELVYRRFLGRSRGGRKAKRVQVSDFLSAPIKLPPTRTEQERIAAVLLACDGELGVTQKLMATLSRQKRGLMQKLLTGQIRVKEADDGR